MTKPAAPVGEDNWVDYVDQARRVAGDLEKRVKVIELYRTAVGAEPGSLKTWLAYCEYFWGLYTAFRSSELNLSRDEMATGCDMFTLDSALHLWSEAYDAIKYRLSDSHELWNRWISLEMEQLVQTRTPEGVRRITHLYRDRLRVPHVTWDETAQMFSTFLSEHNRDAWEQTMQDVTRDAQQAKRLLAARDPFESRLAAASRAGNDEAYKTALREYIGWEVLQSRRNNDKPEIAVDMCCGLFERALAGVFGLDELVWEDYVVFLSQPHIEPQARNLLQVLQRAVDHCPWSGLLWSRYILCAEEAKLPMPEIAHIKHAAMSKPDELIRDGMSSLIDMYLAWCGFLKRTAMDPSASDEDVDVADVGIATALEDVKLEGKRFPNYQGDPQCRLERLYIQYLTEKKGDVAAARKEWNRLSGKRLHADSYNFWLRYYQWEMMVFASRSLPPAAGGQVPGRAPAGPRDPSMATAVLARALKRTTLDYPEAIMEAYLQHCNDYEPPAVVRQAIGDVHRAKKPLERRRQKEAVEAAAAYAEAQAQQLSYGAQQAHDGDAATTTTATTTTAAAAAAAATVNSPPGPKRKWDDEEGPAHKKEDDASSKRLKTVEDESLELKRDREHTSVIVTGLPGDVTQTKVKQYFKEYGHVNSLSLVSEADQTSTALVEFRTAEEATSALLRDGKYFGQVQIQVRSGRNLTLYVTNYPPDADEEFIRGLFKDCGDVISVRFPSLKYNTHRRFCYVSFKDAGAAKKATEKDGKNMAGHGKLVVKFSDPNRKKQREGAVSEGREIHVKELAVGTSESDLRELCARFGAVSRVNVPLNLAGKSRGFAYVSFEKKEQAEAAVAELDKSKFRGSILEVQLAKERNFKQYSKLTLGVGASPSPAPSEHGDDVAEAESTSGHKGGGPPSAAIRARTVALTGLPDTVNDARIRSLVEGTSPGKIIQLTVQPSKGTAKIEFENVGAAGRAVLQLGGKEIDGHHIRAGGVDELRRGELPEDRNIGPAESKPQPATTSKPATMFAPSAVRRPVPGRGLPKRGLGFTTAPAAATKGEGDGQGEGAAQASAAKKTNADFKAMFIASRPTNEAS